MVGIEKAEGLQVIMGDFVCTVLWKWFTLPVGASYAMEYSYILPHELVLWTPCAAVVVGCGPLPRWFWEMVAENSSTPCLPGLCLTC